MKYEDYLVLIDVCKDYVNAFNALYRLHTYDDVEIEKIYREIKKVFIDSELYEPIQILEIISDAAIYNNGYFKSYWMIFKKIFEGIDHSQIYTISNLFDYFVYKEYGILFNEKKCKLFKWYDSLKLSTNVHKYGSIYKAIMDDDKEFFIAYTRNPSFNKNQKLQSEFYPNSEDGYTLLELCCYHGAIGCFNFLLSEFKADITYQCLCLSFLGGNPGIISECLKYRDPGEQCMEYAIISHNIDFISFLMNEKRLQLNLNCCMKHYNLQSFLLH
ncbi:hypothetical protein TVAG_088700 [Trichomonas vaginalis G3]|uniref:DUF3447 domain-containing protein n=1 Tax=Trichomonas vaginalis (strain ATCC PRA-98 / G3) TaxID=412133 RepID=A2EB15_TRIV3|nr:protein of unknown function (DUF3447) [Trichomonas vaginalis G3]EAY10155.1 hypothetical protein TVAG_088700 [Trichomonas vaginalis G3]KAI5534470.1 protein of unknown function (DUF3447) [Trichomonas vaginalis G3]|eukprot:XP_001322378.1 hypothetical protein [Trichomonas vaginalis G3]